MIWVVTGVAAVVIFALYLLAFALARTAQQADERIRQYEPPPTEKLPRHL